MGNTVCSVENCLNKCRTSGFCNFHYQRFLAHGDPLAGRTPNGEKLKWLTSHLSHVGDECLIWPYAVTRGYAYTYLGGKKISVSRYMCIQRNGPPPTPSHEAAHSCGNGNKGCVNPCHLAWKTSKANKADQLAHGTRSRGEKRPGAILNRNKVEEIRKEYAKGNTSYAAIAKKYGVKPEAIYSVVKRRTWAWIE